ncbi:MAG: hypothetical protein OEY28_11740, partial [Nitrospira sp.]|nr:hypothetical protein [Nitrospira sp.]
PYFGPDSAGGKKGALMAEADVVNLRPLMIVAGAVTLVSAALSPFIFSPFWPGGVVLIGGCASWLLGLFIARLGQKKQLKIDSDHSP